MAIIIEEDRKKGGAGLINMALWLLLLVGIGAGAYYVFFKKPQLIEVAAPSDFKNTEQIAKLELRPEEVLSNSQFKALKNYVTIAEPVADGRTNPFLSF